jgi:uncharacterized membrane protein
MKTKVAQAFALLATGLLAGVFYYGTFTVIPAFYEVPIEVHLKYRVALMNHNAVYVQLLTGIAILTPVWLAFVYKKSALIRNYAILAAIAALISILTTRFGNVPINRMMRVWEAGKAPANWREILDKWNMFNDIRTVFALASFVLVLIASQVSRPQIKADVA